MNFIETIKEWETEIFIIIGIGASAGSLLLLRLWLQGPSYNKKTRLDGKVAVITGSNTGIGKETALDLARRGARVILVCRDMLKAKKTADEIYLSTNSDVGVFHMDLASFDSIRKTSEILRQQEPLIHILINNAGVESVTCSENKGVMMCPEWRTVDGFELQFGTNHLGHFLFTLLLLNNIKAAAPSRIINLSSIAHTQGKIHWNDLNLSENYDPKEAYCQSKLANILFTRKLAKVLEGTGITTYAVHPGVVQTDLGRHLELSVNRFIHWAFHFFGKFLFKTVRKGAQTTIYCAVEESLGQETGQYYSDCKRKEPHNNALDEHAAEKLWEISAKITSMDQFAL